MPLNKIKAWVIDANKVNKLKQLTHNKVKLALELVSFDKKYEPAIASVFGSTFVAEDSQTAKTVAMENNGVGNFNCVTIQGDFYRADGVLSGGSD